MTTAIMPEPTKKAPKRNKGKKAPAKKKSGKGRNGALAKAWEIFGKHPKAARKDAVAAAVKAGINESTARTQFQKWMHRNEK